MSNWARGLFPFLAAALLLAVAGGRARAEELASEPVPPHEVQKYERAGNGGFAIELSAGGVSSSSFAGGILAGIGARGFVFGLFLDALQDAKSPPVPPNTIDTRTGSARLGIATRVPLLRTKDGRVSLFGALDMAVTNRTVSPYSADGWTWSVGPGLRFWLTDHLALAYLTRFRSTHLSGAAAALPDVDVPAGTDPGASRSADYLQLEGTFQFLCVF